MSFQLVHTSYPHLLDSSASGYGTVARSEKLPPALGARLTALSTCREPRGGYCSRGAQFSYRIVEHAGEVWHVLTCVQDAGADYTGRGCFTAHHLIFTQQEVEQLLADEHRPTPSGVMLALYNSGFWIRKWQGEPRYLINAPHMMLERMPDASVQPTWKQLTGHKSNARAFYTHPYDRECLVTLPCETPVQSILGLFHESDWLTHSRGWGITFTTEADDSDSFAETLRMITLESSPLVQRAMRTGHPVLKISADMELPVEPVSPSGTDGQPTAAGNNNTDEQPNKGVTRVLSRTVSHYHYTEEPDWMLYDVPIPRSMPYLLPMAACGVTILLSGIAFGIWLGLSDSVREIEDFISQSTEAQPEEVQATGIQKLLDYLSGPHQAEESRYLLQELTLLDESIPEDALLKDCAKLILNSTAAIVDHTSALKRLCENSRLLGLNEADMGRLYIQQATYGLTPEEWHARHGLDTQDAWELLTLQEPGLAAIFSTDALEPYKPGNVVTPPVPPTVETAGTGNTPQEKESPVITQQQVKGMHPVVCGNAIPAPLEQLLAGLTEETTVTSGAYSIFSIIKGEPVPGAIKLELSPSEYHLCIKPTKNKGEYKLGIKDKDGNKADFPVVTFAIRDNKLIKVRSNNGDTVVIFPIPTNKETLTNIVLAPSINYPIPSGDKDISFPAVNLVVTPDQLSVEKTERGYTLKLKNNKMRFPWRLNPKKHIERIQFLIHLPDLNNGKSNRIVTTYDEDSAFVWQKAEERESQGTPTLRCEVLLQPQFPKWLKQTFHNVANAPCCGNPEVKKQSLSLAHLYYIAKRLQDDKKPGKLLFQAYYELFANKKFNDELQKIMQNTPDLLLSVEQASGNRASDKFARTKVKQLLSKPQSSQHIINHICNVLSASLIHSYAEGTKAFEKEQKKKPVLTLKKISQGKHGEIIWHFHLKSGK